MIVPFKGEKDVCDEVPKIAKGKKASELFVKYKVPQNCPFNAVSITYVFHQIKSCFYLLVNVLGQVLLYILLHKQ
jgi:hypothetical protein